MSREKFNEGQLSGGIYAGATALGVISWNDYSGVIAWKAKAKGAIALGAFIGDNCPEVNSLGEIIQWQLSGGQKFGSNCPGVFHRA